MSTVLPDEGLAHSDVMGTPADLLAESRRCLEAGRTTGDLEAKQRWATRALNLAVQALESRSIDSISIKDGEQKRFYITQIRRLKERYERLIVLQREASALVKTVGPTHDTSTWDRIFANDDEITKVWHETREIEALQRERREDEASDALPICSSALTRDCK
jgi:hypothetical protein